MIEEYREGLVEKLLADEKVSEQELIDILLFLAVPQKDVGELANEIIVTFGDIRRAFFTDWESLKIIKGMTDYIAAFFITVGKCMHICMEKNIAVPKKYSYEGFKGPLYWAFRPFLSECFVAFFLDESNNVILRKIFSSHSSSHVEVDMHELIKGVLLVHPKAVVVCHNHMRNATPSYEDDKMTGNLYLALKFQNVELLDHLIVAKNDFFSYKRSKKLDKLIKQFEPLL